MNQPINSFCWSGINANGEQITGIIQARNTTLAKSDLRRQGIFIQQIAQQRQPFFDRDQRKIKPQDISFFSRQLATLIKTKVSLVQSLTIIANGQTNRAMRDLLESIKMKLEAGFSFSQSLATHPKFFNPLFCHLIDAGEKAGRLDILCENLALYKEKLQKNKLAVKKALTYPAVILFIAFLVTAALLLCVVPQFENLFKSFSAELPLLTRAVVCLSRFCQRYGGLFLIMIATLVYGIYHYRQRPVLTQTFERYVLKVPYIGAIIAKSALARFSRTLSITLASGLPLIDSLQCVAGATGNIVYSDACAKIQNDVCRGHSIQASMKTLRLFPVMLIEMIAVGEESGTLEFMLAKAADFYEEEVDHGIATLNHLLEPVIMALLGILVGGLILALYLPIFKLGSAL